MKNSIFTFENFIVSRSNRDSFNAILTAVKFPGEIYNPLIINNSNGAGATHLLCAVADRIKQIFPTYKVITIKAYQLVNEMLQHIREGRAEEFLYKYQDNCDVLIIDDIQFLAGRKIVEKEICHIITALHKKEKQVIISSSNYNPPCFNLEGTLAVQLKSPDKETRLRILKDKAQAIQIPLSDKVALYVVSHIKKNVRELESILTRLEALINLSNLQINIRTTKNILKIFLKKPVNSCH